MGLHLLQQIAAALQPSHIVEFTATTAAPGRAHKAKATAVQSRLDVSDSESESSAAASSSSAADPTDPDAEDSSRAIGNSNNSSTMRATDSDLRAQFTSSELTRSRTPAGSDMSDVDENATADGATDDDTGEASDVDMQAQRRTSRSESKRRTGSQSAHRSSLIPTADYQPAPVVHLLPAYKGRASKTRFA